MEKILDNTPYRTEDIPNEAAVFYRIHEQYIDKDESDEKRKIKPSAFDPFPKPDGTEMSVDWSKYSSAQLLKDRARKPEKNGIVSFNVALVRENPTPLKVEHRPTYPDPDNRSHSIVFDVMPNSNDPEIRIKLRRICQWEILI